MADPADLAQHQIEQAEQVREQQRLARQSAEMGAWRVTECQDCGEPIEAARKAVVPATTLCAECARLDERKRTGRWVSTG